MKRKILLRTALLATTLMLFGSVGWGQGLEDFTNFPETSTTYNSGTFVGNDGSTWTYVKTAGPSAEAITAPTPLLGRNQSPAAEVTSGTISGGIGTLSFDYKQAFSTNVNLQVYVNGSLITTVTTSAEQDVIKNSGSITVDIAGDFVISFKQPTGAGQVNIDNITWTGYTPPAANDDDSYISNPQNMPIAASYLSTYASLIEPFRFKIFDEGTADGLPTDVTQITLRAGPNNTADWSTAIEFTLLSKINESTSMMEEISSAINPTITSNSITYTITGSDLSIADGGSQAISFMFTLTDKVEDNSVFQFMVDADNHGFLADGINGSAFASTFAADVVGNNFTIEVEATRLSFTSQPTSSLVNKVLSPAVEVAATDANGNVDVDFAASAITLSYSGTGNMSGTNPVTTAQGVANFGDLSFDTEESRVTLSATGGSLTGATSSTFDVFDAPLFISEYIEGSSSNKAIEIYNPSSNPVDLSNYSVNLAGNGGAWNATPQALSGTLNAGDVYVIGNSSAVDSVKAVSNIFSSVTYYNGDDAVGLFYNDVLIDAIGVQGIDPGASWPVAGSGSTVEYTLVRKASVTSGNTNWTASAGTNAGDSEWVVKPQDRFSYLGWHGADYIGIWDGAEWSSTTTPDNSFAVRMDADYTTSSVEDWVHLFVSSGATFTASNNTTLSGKVVLNPGANLTIETGNTLTSDKVTLKAGTDKTLASLLNFGTLTASTVEYQRYMPTTVFEYVSSPVQSQTAAVFGTLGTSSAEGNGLFWFSESGNSWENITEGTTPIGPMSGYAYIPNANTTVTFSGTAFYSGSMAKALSASSTGFNLVGNPYPAAINWDFDGDWSRENVTPNIWINFADAPNEANFATYNSVTDLGTNWIGNIGDEEGVIPSTQAFWVEASAATTLTVYPTAQQHSPNPVAKKSTSENPLVRLQAQRSGYSDEMVIFFHSEATEGMDRFDTRKKLGSGAYPQIYAPVADAIAAVNTLPQSLLSDKVIVPITLKSDMAGSVTLTLTELKNLEEDINIILTDKATGAQTDLRTSAYTVEVEAGSTLTNRLEVTIERKNTTSAPAIDKSTVNIYASAKNIYVGMAQQGSSVEVYNAIGVQMLSQKLNGGAVESIQTNLPKGVYIVVVNGSEGRTVKRVFIN